MFSQEFECPSCGAPIKQNKPGSQTLGCTYCGQTSHLNANTLAAVGEQRLLIDYGSSLSIGQQGKYKDRDFIVLGRLRIDYKDGFWDEWYITFLDDGTDAWIQEDDGSFVLFIEKQKISDKFRFKDIKVGTYDDLQGEWESIFITEKSRATINGGEGELPFRIIPGQKADFVDGIWKGKIVSIEILPTERVLFLGTPFKLRELAFS